MTSRSELKPLQTKCPECGHHHSESSDVVGWTHTAIRLPETGDLTLCNGCGAVLIFTSDTLADRLATPDELVRGYSEQQRLILRMRQAQIRAERERRRRAN